MQIFDIVRISCPASPGPTLLVLGLGYLVTFKRLNASIGIHMVMVQVIFGPDGILACVVFTQVVSALGRFGLILNKNY